MLHIFVCELLSEEALPVTETDIAQTAANGWRSGGSTDCACCLRRWREAFELIACDRPLFLGSAHIAYNHG
jgi:hypothetical protein